MAAQDLRVGVLGTSNAVAKDGWAAALAAQPGVSIVGNASLGSSHATMLPYRLPSLDAVDMDVLILDICVNEQRAANKNLYDLSQSSQILDYVLGWCSSRKVIPVVLILPVKENQIGARATTVRQHWISVAKKAGIPYFDGYAFATDLSFYARKSIASLFKDDHHLSGEVQQIMAKKLTERLKAFLSIARMSRRFKFVHPFRYVSTGGDVERRTSLLAERFLRLSEGDALVVNCGRGSIVGAVVNMAQTNASLCFKGKTRLLKRLDSAYFDPARPIWLVAWSLLSPVKSRGGTVLVKQTASSACSMFEDNDHTRNGALPSPDFPPIVEIAGFVVRDPKRLMTVVSTRGSEIDLLRL
ncbi:hypothetical protein IB238_09065 [Rhizobium sp. ARZ01]|uniref:SGNH/GDSL hydrolase family protein n=1 Tax=Rhizobium sp. ARZ01 TaxID=2769313 RepID=UPI00177F1387|nr:SGNH/GDSL hydrolase family protein [Rhizobium sp. ARZ01]MBD9372770.1 hypothetical protein [Rhizobium sp. ARZ01]